MGLGVKHVLKLHEYQDPNDATVGGQLILDAWTRKAVLHNASFVAPTTVVRKNDFPGSDNDGWTVEYTYPEGGEPNLTTLTVDAMRVQAAVDINAAFSGEVNSGTTNVSAY